MSRRPPATREAHDDFCTTEEWTLVRGDTGKPVTHHRTYELALQDGRILRTRISRPVDRTEYRASMCSHILRQQLEVTAEQFWACVNGGILPQRGDRPTPPEKSLPLYLVEGLARHGVPAQEISLLSEEEAERRLHGLWNSEDRSQ